MKAKAVILALALALGLPLTTQAGFQEFSLYFKMEPRGRVNHSMPKEMVFHMDGNRMRQEILTREGRSVFIMELDGDKLVSTILDLDNKTYIRNVTSADDDIRFLFELPRGDESPCRKAPHSTCKRLGTDRIRSYRVVKWQITDRDGKPEVFWYAPRLGFFLRSEDDVGIMTVTRIEDRAPPASLFKPPAGFREISHADFFGGQGKGSR